MVHLPRIPLIDSIGNTIDSDFKLTGKNIRSQSIASSEDLISDNHLLQYSAKHNKTEKLGNKLMKRKWEKSSGSGNSPKDEY